MILQQVSLFLENRSGQLAAITGLLAENGIDLRAINVAETADYGIIRLIVSEPERAAQLLLSYEFISAMSPVVAAQVPDRPGGLHSLLDLIQANHIDISYMYSIFGRSDGLAGMIFRVSDPEALESLLLANGIPCDAGF